MARGALGLGRGPRNTKVTRYGPGPTPHAYLQYSPFHITTSAAKSPRLPHQSFSVRRLGTEGPVSFCSRFAGAGLEENDGDDVRCARRVVDRFAARANVYLTERGD